MNRSVLSSLFDLVYPSICVGCKDEIIRRPSIFCITCATSLPYTHMESQNHNEFEKHFTGRLHIQAGTSLFYFTKGGIIQEAIHAMKYENVPDVGYHLGKSLGSKLKDHPIYKSCDAVIGVPLHKKKKRKRGYNQADYIAKGIGEIMEIPVFENAVVRQRMTLSQTKKTRIKRMRNLQNGFAIKNLNEIEGRHILLVDDVLTSGATLDYCGQVILNQTNTKLSLATLAMGSVV